MPSVSELQQSQQRIVSAMLAAVALNQDEDSIADLKAEYIETVTGLEQALGPAAPCWDVDIVTWDEYRAAFVEAGGNNPSFASRQEAQVFLFSGAR